VIAGQACPQVSVGMGDLDGDGVDQPQAGIESTTSRSRHAQLGQPAAPGRAEQGGQLGDDTQVGQQRVQLRLHP
jgi:hypothetical protein